MDTGQQIFRNNVKTLSVYNPDNFLAPPVIRIGSHDKLNINFDIIGDDFEYLRYKVIHCNSDWQPSRLMESEYLNGFNEIEIDDYAFSSNTYIHYVNYNIAIPNPELPIIHSGNYLLQVYPEYEPDNIILQARFSVSEQISMIKGGITTRTDQGTDSEFQQLFLNTNISSLRNINPYQDLIIGITQNNRPETLRFINHPIRVEGGNVIFEHAPQLIFEAGNEYRRFETVRTDYPGMHVDSVKFMDGIWHAWLQPDAARTHKEYTFDSTQHGRFKIDEYNSTEPDLSADYVMVHFSLDPIENQKGLIFVDGDFTQHQFNDSNLMRYDWNDGLYHADIPLKQGSYNYQYILLPENGGLPSSRNIEGNKYETQNEYLVQVFLRLPGSRGDRLIGTTVL
ncbi:MAG: DUF5103 domain-containing protein [Muribaculaceae bacterium]|nr:DUF5103 domain-containing protein [Muribaculaceae bacterium]